MLQDYMKTAQDDLQTKEEICNVKQQRLQLAQDEVGGQVTFLIQETYQSDRSRT